MDILKLHADYDCIHETFEGLHEGKRALLIAVDESEDRMVMTYLASRCDDDLMGALVSGTTSPHEHFQEHGYAYVDICLQTWSVIATRPASGPFPDSDLPSSDVAWWGVS